MKAAIVGLLAFMLLAGCADLDDLPTCDYNAPPTLAVEGWRYWQDNSLIVKELVEKGWRNIQRGSSEGIYAECHASASWNEAGVKRDA